MKYCSKCDTEKPVTEFYKNSKRYDGLDTYCKACDSKRKAKVYKERLRNDEDYVARQKEWAKSRRRKLVERVKEVKRQGCAVCGYDRSLRSLHFHHVDDHLKEGSINSLVTGRYSDEVINEELGKCVVLCANCHGEVHDGIITLSDDLERAKLPPVKDPNE